jgi:hypothetical protein
MGKKESNRDKKKKRGMYDPTRDDIEEQFGEFMHETEQKAEDGPEDCLPEWLRE